MAKCDPPEPHPLLREPKRALPTASDRNRVDREARERELERDADFFLPIHRRGEWGWGCLVLIGLPLPLLSLVFLLV